MTDPSIVCWVLELEINRYKGTMVYPRMQREATADGWWAPGASGYTSAYSLEAGLRTLREKTRKHTRETYRLRNLITGDIIMGDACGR